MVNYKSIESLATLFSTASHGIQLVDMDEAGTVMIRWCKWFDSTWADLGPCIWILEILRWFALFASPLVFLKPVTFVAIIQECIFIFFTSKKQENISLLNQHSLISFEFMWGGKLSPYYFFILQLVLERKASNKTNFLEILLEHHKTYWDNLFLMMAEVFNFLLINAAFIK